MDFLVVAAISTINVEVVLGEFVRCFHRPPGNSSPTRRSTAGGGGTRKPAHDPIGYGREAMRWRMWSNWRQVSAGSGGQSLKKYNRFDITDHHRSDMGPSKPMIAVSHPPQRAISFQDTSYGRRSFSLPKSRNIAVLSPHRLRIGAHAPEDQTTVILGFADRGSAGSHGRRGRTKRQISAQPASATFGQTVIGRPARCKISSTMVLSVILLSLAAFGPSVTPQAR